MKTQAHKESGREHKRRFVPCEQCGKMIPEDEYDTCGCVYFSCAFDNMGD